MTDMAGGTSMLSDRFRDQRDLDWMGQSLDSDEAKAEGVKQRSKTPKEQTWPGGGGPWLVDVTWGFSWCERILSQWWAVGHREASGLWQCYQRHGGRSERAHALSRSLATLGQPVQVRTPLRATQMNGRG